MARRPKPLDIREPVVQGGMELEGADLAIPAPQRDGWRYEAPGEVWIVSGPSASGEPNPDAFPRLETRPGGGGPLASAAEDCLGEFIRLDETSDEEFPARVLALAQRWGLLGICCHRKPSSHRIDRRCYPLGSFGSYANPATVSPWEPIEAWRRYSRQLRAILNIAVDLQLDRPGSSRDWAAVQGAEPDFRHPLRDWGTPKDDGPPSVNLERWGPKVAGDISSERAALAAALTRWLHYGRVVPHGHWTEGEAAPAVRLFHESLTGVLAVQLAAALQSPQGVHRCDGCGYPFPSQGARRPARGKRKWCSRCGRNAQWKDYQRRKYVPKKAGSGKEAPSHGD